MCLCSADWSNESEIRVRVIPSEIQGRANLHDLSRTPCHTPCRRLPWHSVLRNPNCSPGTYSTPFLNVHRPDAEHVACFEACMSSFRSTHKCAVQDTSTLSPPPKLRKRRPTARNSAPPNLESSWEGLLKPSLSPRPHVSYLLPACSHVDRSRIQSACDHGMLTLAKIRVFYGCLA